MPNPNEINPRREVSAEPDAARIRDDKVHRLDRPAGEAKDALPLGQVTAPDVRALNPSSREAEVKDKAGASPDPKPDTPETSKKSRIRSLMFALLPLVLIVGAFWYVIGGQTISMDDAYVEADKVGVSTDVAGIVKQVAVAENQYVEAGQILYRLEDLQFRLALQRAEAQIGTVRDSLNALKTNYRDMQAQIQQAQNDIDYFNTEFHRQQDLLAAHVASQSTFDTARRNLQNAQQKLVSLNQQLDGIAASLDSDPDGPVEKNPRYLDAIAQRDEAARQLAHTFVKAPFAGIVTNVPSIAPGKYLQASATAFYLVATDRVWVVANPKETELTYVRAGQPATVSVDTYPDLQWNGSVESISPAAAQEFSLLPAQNTSGNWVKVVQRIPVRVRVDTKDKSLPPLRAGMSVEVDVDTGHRRGLPHFLTAMFGHDRQGR
ncbi:HlyD family secretion protein [Bradyrhizobium sp. dw_78]|uniref:HlyD family secretion protein n=1 Tax=Bradyrhizobium sp. dw_78 TaxID=2719793 RepID=UPI00320A3F78